MDVASRDPEDTADSILDEVGGVVPDASRLSESFVPEESGLFSDDEAEREVDAKHDAVQRRLRDTQRELRQVANDLEQVIDYANAPIFGIDLFGKVNEWNRKAVALTGFSRDEVMGLSLIHI